MSGRPNIFSRLLFLWVGAFIHRNTVTPLTLDTLLEIPQDFKASTQLKRLQDAISTMSRGPLKLARAVLWSVRREIAKIGLISFVHLVSGLSSPLVLRQLLSALEGKLPEHFGLVASLAQNLHIPTTTAYALVCSVFLFLLGIISMLSIHHLFFVQVGMSVKVQTSLRALIYLKAMRLARAERGEASNGQIMSIMSTDTSKVMSWTQFLHALWYHPIQITLALTFLYQLVGVAAIYGTLALLIPLVFAGGLVRLQNRLRQEILRTIDKRVGFTAEVLSHIKTVKFQAWERPLSERILKLREREVEGLRRVNFLSSIAGLTSNIAPAIAMLVTFSVYVLQGGTLDAALVFPAMGLIFLLRFALNTLPDSLFNTLEALISLDRIEQFLQRPEHVPPVPVLSLPHAIQIADANFEWSKGVSALKVTSLTIDPGQLVAIVGAVGSGKTALLLGLLNEIQSPSGSVRINAPLGYVAQQPWIVSDSIRHNILSGRAFDEVRYRRVVRAASLEHDLKILPHGDETEIGERGVNLSGGQRQRVALARALYAGAGIYLLDDPLSALDPTVANQVFENLVCNELRHATRILVTHRLEYALRADRVIVIEGGGIVEDGTPEELKAQGARFKELLEFHSDVSTVSPRSTPPLIDSASTDTETDSQESSSTAEESHAIRSVVEAEERDVGAVDKGVVGDYLKRFMPGLIAPVLIAVVLGRHALSVGTDLWLTLFSQGPALSYQVFIGGYCALISLLALAHFARWYLFLSSGLRAGISSHAALLKGILAAPLRFFESNPVGRILNRFSRDLETIENSLPRALQDCTHCALDVTVVCAILLFIEPVSILLLIPVFIFYFFLQKQFRPTSREAQRLDSIARSPVFAIFSESLNGVDTLRASGLLSTFQEQLDQYLNTNSRTGYCMMASNRWVGLRLEFLAAIVILVCGVSVSLLPSTVVPTALAGLLLTYAISFGGAMNWFVRALVQTESNLTSYERMRFYSQTPSEKLVGALPPHDWPRRGEITLKSLTVRYRPELEPALNSLSCTIPAGKRVGIIGRTGSGKSSLILALGRLLEPSSGHTEIDGLNTSTISLESLRSALTVVPQEPVLFSGPLRDTLDPFRNSSDDDIMASLKRVELDIFVRSLPGGLNYTVLEGGANFSSGQRQLLCLARALLRDSHIIILDEATANIDVETDFAIQRTIRREFSGATVIVVAHRLGTVIDSDLIMVLERGRIAEFGAPEDLLSNHDSLLSMFVREMQRSHVA